MTVSAFSWPLVGDYVNRTEELARLQAWWDEPTREPVALLGRRRVGKSWLFRRFADGKPAVILVAEQLPAQSQLTRLHFGNMEWQTESMGVAANLLKLKTTKTMLQ